MRSGKVRCIGFSDSPAWKVTRAQTIAKFRGWAPLIALQIEYSLLERTVESELVPMAQELGLGITPWSPLKGGMLSGKYTRVNQGAVSAGRCASIGVLKDKDYTIIDQLMCIADELETTSAAVALAWIHSRPGHYVDYHRCPTDGSVGSQCGGARSVTFC